MSIGHAQEHVSPYSSKRYREIAWQKVSPGWLGIYRAVAWAKPPVLEYLKKLKFATRSQLLRHFYISKENGRKNIERMARTGILVRHSLVSWSGDTAFYTLGPIGCDLVRERWIPNWWLSVALIDVLKHLAMGDLYLGIASIWPCTYVETDWPLTCFLTFGGYEYGVIVLRDDIETIRRKVARSLAMRLIVVVERIGDAARLNTVLDVPARFILDRDLICKQFSQCIMYRFDGGLLVKENLYGDTLSAKA